MDNASGFTLLEAMVAFVVVSLVALATLGQSVSASRARGDAAEAMTAAALAEYRLEALRVYPIDRLLPLPDSMRRGHFDAPYEHYAWSTRIERMRQEPSLLDVEVVVLWPSGSFDLRTRWYRP